MNRRETGRRSWFLLLVFLFLINGGFSSLTAQPPSAHPTLVLHNGRVLTLDQNDQVAEAVAIREDRIQAVGSSPEILNLAGPATRRIDLAGQTLIPGMTDSHFHLVSSALALQKLQLTSARNMAELVEIIAREAESVPAGEWIVASRNWTLGQLEENRLTTRRELDGATTRHPVWVPRGGHRGVANSLALQLAGITTDTPVPEGGEIGRDGTGELNGLLLDTAQAQLRAVLPQSSRQDLLEAVVSMQQSLNAAGYTSIILGGAAPDHLRLLQDLRDAGRLNLRVAGRIRVRSMEQYQDLAAMPRTGFGDSWLRISSIKMGIDGGSDGNMFTQPYLNRPDFHGIQVTPTETLRQVTLEGNREGWSFAYHCNGDAAFDLLLPILEEANAQRSLQGRRWTIEHGRYPRMDQIKRLQELGLWFSVQANPYWLSSVHIEGFGRERAAYGNPLRRLIDAGIPLAGGTDHGVFYSPFLHIWWYVTRQTRDSGVLGIENAITAREALILATRNPPHLTFEESQKGTIEPGKLADLVVLDSDPLQLEPSELRDVKVVATLVGGRLVHGDF